ncbi:MAG: hypothetical protein KF841_00350 [Phycisphaerae bacterium]|nr:hypothetical protein [Phycisphaerae bacterium]
MNPFRRSFAIVIVVACVPLLLGQTCGIDMNGNNNNNNTNGNNNNNQNDNSQSADIFRIYGDGSAGAKVVSSDENWNTPANRQVNLNFTDLTINQGVTLIVPSGMVIRCKGQFTNYGTLFVRPAAEGGFSGRTGPGGPNFATTSAPAAIGIATGPAQAGDIGDSTVARRAGRGGDGLSEFEARLVLNPGTRAGGGGAVGGMDTDADGVSLNSGADGGGSVVIIAQGKILNAGAIQAEGESGNKASGNDLGGGGGGGVVVLASVESVSNTGTISVRGGDGEDSDSNNGPSGGGGGGVIHLISPVIDNEAGSDGLLVDGGAAGDDSAQITENAMRYAGGGGGASAGAGGAGGSIPDGAGPVFPDSADSGANGFAFMTELNPQLLIRF